MKGIVKGMLYTQGNWDEISFDLDNDVVHYMGSALENFTHEDITDVITRNTLSGKLVLGDGVKPLQFMNRFKLC